jgi:hypothetical protein
MNSINPLTTKTAVPHMATMIKTMTYIHPPTTKTAVPHTATMIKTMIFIKPPITKTTTMSPTVAMEEMATTPSMIIQQRSMPTALPTGGRKLMQRTSAFAPQSRIAFHLHHLREVCATRVLRFRVWDHTPSTLTVTCDFAKPAATLES